MVSISSNNADERMTGLHDVVDIEDERIRRAESSFSGLKPLRCFRGNYGVPRILGNKVVKGYFYSTEDELDLLEKLHDEYVRELGKSIPVVNTQVIRNGNLMYLVQPYLRGYTFEKMLQEEFTPEQKSQVFQEILRQALTVATRSDKTIGIDGKPENWIYENDRWTLLDTFPPFLIEKNNAFAQIFNLREFERAFAKNPERTYFRDPSKIIRRMWLKSEKFYSEINYRELALDTVKSMNLPNRIYRMVQRLK